MPIRTKYYWAHINDVSVDAVKALLPTATVVADGHCGSVWSEYHPDCPHPLVVVVEPTQAMLKVLERAHVGHSADKNPDVGEDVKDFKWVEDDRCLERESFLIDHRTPYGYPSREA